MSTFLNATEIVEIIANANIPNFPKTVKNILQVSKRELWVSRKRKGRGGGLEFDVSTLPEPIRRAIEAQQAAQLLPAISPQNFPAKHTGSLSPTQTALPFEQVKSLNDKQKLVADARMSIVAEILHIARLTGMSQKAAATYFLQQFETGKSEPFWAQQIQTANARSNIAKIEMRSLCEWLARYQKAQTPNERIMLLAPKPTKRKKSFLEYGWLPKFAEFHCTTSAPPLAHSYEQFADWWVNHMPVNDLPNVHMVRRVWKMLPPQMQERGRKTGQAYKSLLAHSKRDWDILEPNDVWIGDGHSFKAKIANPKHGKPYVPEVTMVIDGCTRKIVGFSVSLSESTKAVCDALRIGMKTHPVPKIYYSDNGAGQTGKLIDHPVMGLCARLGIVHETGLPGNPQGRGVIEGLWDITLIKQARRYATFTGSSMDKSSQHLIQRKLNSAVKAESQKQMLNSEQLKYKAMLPSFGRFMSDLVDTVNAYNARAHNALPRKADGGHFSPNEYYDYRMARLAQQLGQEAFSEQYPILAQDELELLYRPEQKRITRNGWLTLFHENYFAAELVPYHEQNIRVAFDWDNPKDVIVYDSEGRFICKALHNGNTRPAFDVKSIAEKEAIKRVRAQIKRKQDDIARALADIRGDLIEHRPDFGKLVSQTLPANDVLIAQEVEILDVEAEYIPPKRSKYAF